MLEIKRFFLQVREYCRKIVSKTIRKKIKDYRIIFEYQDLSFGVPTKIHGLSISAFKNEFSKAEIYQFLSLNDLRDIADESR